MPAIPAPARMLERWETVRNSFWFLPTVMSATAALLARGLLALDRGEAARWVQRYWPDYGGGAEGASAVLQTIAGSMMTIAGVVFSLTLVALSQASRQFGPRLLRNLMRDTVTQVVLGAFVATFLYAVLVLLAVRLPAEGPFVPHLAVGMGVTLAVASMVVLVYFIHHVALSIQADEQIARVNAELLRQVDVLFPEQAATAPHPPPAAPHAFSPRMPGGRAVAARGDGYVQRIDVDGVAALAAQRRMVVRLDRRPGDFVAAGESLATAWPGEEIDPRTSKRLDQAFVVGSQRTPAQDIRFGVQQLVEIALRALSPSINDPFTAMSCIDRLGAVLQRIARRTPPPSCRFDRDGSLRVVADPVTFAQVVECAFEPIRQAAGAQARVMGHAARILASLLDEAAGDEGGAALRRQLERISEVAARHPPAAEWQEVRSACDRALRLPGEPARSKA